MKIRNKQTNVSSSVIHEKGLRVRSVRRNDSAVLRCGGDAFSYSMTWLSSDQQLVTACDGAGWPEIPEKGYWSSRLFSITGDPQYAIFNEMPGYPDVSLWEYMSGSIPPYYSLGMLAANGRVYQFLSTSSYGLERNCVDGHFNGAKLIYSPDNGRRWYNQDGSTPVLLESYENQSRGTMVFFQESQDAFSILTFLQMGKDYRYNSDGYIYVYSQNGATEGSMNELVMFRVHCELMLDRNAYEFFGGIRADGSPRWVKGIDDRAVVHTFPRGLISPLFPLAWQPSIVYNAPLDVYMMVNSNSAGANAKADKATYLGLWIARKPWGPWTQIHEETAWLPAGDLKARAAWPQIAPKWIAEDGRSFWLVWTDVQPSSNENVSTPSEAARTEADFKKARIHWRRHRPYFAFNTQRVDLIMD